MTTISFIDIATVISLVLTLYLSYKVIGFVVSVRKEKKKSRESLNSSIDGYDQICSATYALENERQANTGVHHKEEVYIERAKLISEKSDFFSFVKCD